ncbi:MAG: UDP-glucose 4-epimerase GalE [Candidatus Omnitrophica bacterium]|nr:UDP-glucose 4-epimerase GalE [Candidatus Omnitrophota bacterium]
MSDHETVLVIGGAGYIGSVNVEALVAAGKRVIVADNFEYGHREAVHPDAVIEECDIRDGDAVRGMFDAHTIDAVMHFGAYAYVGESMTQAERYFHNNFIGGYNLLNAMRDHDVKRIVFSSTCATYGDVQEVPIDESHPQQPINPYGCSKLAFELLLRSYEISYGIRHAILRYFNASGATAEHGEDHNPETHLIPLVLQVALGQREHISIFGADYDTPDGSCIRDYIHVSDLADAHIRALEYCKNESLFCNLGSEHGYSVREVIEAARKITKHPIPAVEAERRAGDPPRLVASSKKAKELLGWTPRFTDIDKIVETAWLWHQKHPNGYAW